MTEKRDFDAIFVGGGVIGLSCAWRAAQRGARVAVLDRAEPPAGATRVAAGMLAPVGELAFGEPELLEMTLASAQLYPEFVAELEAASGESTGYARQGALHVALDRDEAAELRRVHDLQRSLGLEAEWLPPRRCRELEPGLTPSFNGGVHAPGEAAVDPRALTAALLARSVPPGRSCGPRPRAAKNGAEGHGPGDVNAGLFEGERLVGVRTAGGEELRRRPSCWPPAPGPAPPSGCPSPPARRCARSRARSSSCAAATAPPPASGSSPPSASTWCRAPTAA